MPSWKVCCQASLRIYWWRPTACLKKPTRGNYLIIMQVWLTAMLAPINTVYIPGSITVISGFNQATTTNISLKITWWHVTRKCTENTIQCSFYWVQRENRSYWLDSSPQEVLVCLWFLLLLSFWAFWLKFRNMASFIYFLYNLYLYR